MRIKQLITSLSPKRVEHWLMLSIFLYGIAKMLLHYLPGLIPNLTFIFCSIAFFCIIIRNFKGIPLRGLTRFLYIMLICWSLCLTIHMFFLTDISTTFTKNEGLKTWLLAYSSSQYFMPNMIPLLILIIPKNHQFDFRYLWRIMWLMCILYLCFYPYSFWSMIHYQWSTVRIEGEEWGDKGTYGDFIMNSTKGISYILPFIIMVFFKKYLPQKMWNLFLGTAIGNILIQAYMARRGNLVISLLYFVLIWGIYLIHDKKTSKLKIIMISFFIVILCYLLFNNIADSLFATLIERGIEDTRSGVEEGFYADMKTTNDWLFGRGWFGQYYDPIFKEYRSGIETGYLTLILRGGLLYTILYIGILIISFINGYFRSKNLFCKSFAIICLIQIISLYPFGWPEFNFTHFFIWLGVWVSNSAYYRKMNDKQIKINFF